MDVNVKVRFFAVAREWMGASSVEVSVPDGATTEAVWDFLQQREPKFSAWRDRLRLAVNDEYVSAPVALRAGDVVAVIPPVSGG